MLSPTSQLTALLFTPGSRPERFAKAAGSGADGIIVDLEDAVPVMDKDRVRAEVAKFFNTNIRIGLPPFVSAIRVNSGNPVTISAAPAPPIMPSPRCRAECECHPSPISARLARS